MTLPVLDLIERDAEYLVPIARKYGREGMKTILAGKRAAITVLFDDVVTQQIAAAEGVAVVGTQVLLEHLLDQGRLAQRAYINAIVTLSRLNYGFLRLSARDLYAALPKKSSTEMEGFGALIGRLSDLNCNTASAVKVGAELVARVCLSNGLSDQTKSAAIGSALVAPALRHGIRVCSAIRDTFLTMIAARWYVADGRLNPRLNDTIIVLQAWINHLRQVWEEKPAKRSRRRQTTA